MRGRVDDAHGLFTLTAEEGVTTVVRKGESGRSLADRDGAKNPKRRRIDNGDGVVPDVGDPELTVVVGQGHDMASFAGIN